MAPAIEKVAGLRRYLGIQTPASPLTIYAAALPHGMSGGFFARGTKPEEYAAFIADLGLDTIFEPAASLPPPSDPESFERRGAELGRRGVRFGLQYDQNWSRPSLQHPNLTFLPPPKLRRLAHWLRQRRLRFLLELGAPGPGPPLGRRDDRFLWIAATQGPASPKPRTARIPF